jgi:hypothetical protein
LSGQLVSAVLWAASAAIAETGRRGLAEVVIVAGGFFIFPLTLLSLKLAGRSVASTKGSPMNALAIQVAFTVPLGLPAVLTLAHFAPNLFYPATLMLVGAHYLPFATLYGMKHWLVLAGTMVVGGFVLGWELPLGFAAGGWLGAALLAIFAVVGWRLVVAEERRAHA